jgi:hypothetical protein
MADTKPIKARFPAGPPKEVPVPTAKDTLNTTLSYMQYLQPLQVAAQFAGNTLGKLIKNPEATLDKGGYLPGVSELLYRTINPGFDYYKPQQSVRVLTDAIANMPAALNLDKTYTYSDEADYDNPLQDAWATYLGLPQANNSFSPSSYRPSKSTDPTNKYYKFNDLAEVTGGFAGGGEDMHWYIQDLLQRLKNNSDSGAGEIAVGSNHAMGNYKWSKGADEKGSYISYYDKWDLMPTLPGNIKPNLSLLPVGKPFELYDRIYYDPKTYKQISQPTGSGGAGW